MPAERILDADTLKVGKDKLNKAIEQANKSEVVSADAVLKSLNAIDKADDAIGIAEIAKDTANNTRTELNAVVVRETDTDAMSRQAAVTADGVDKINLKKRLDDDYNEISVKVEETGKDLKLGTMALPPAKLGAASVNQDYTGPFIIAYIDDVIYGFANNTTIVKTTDEGITWSNVATAPYGSVHSLYFTNDGEVIIANSGRVSKSKGWSVNPATVTWLEKVSISSTGVGILPWGIDGDGTKFIATEYSGANRADSRYIWLSTDAGNNWSIVFDAHPLDPEATSHIHGVCYDKWADRFFVSHGHGVLRGVYWSDDNGVNWNKIGGDFQPDAAPTTLTATDNGIVCGSDSGDGGLYGIIRTQNPTDMRMVPVARWYTHRQGVTGFAYRAFRDKETGIVYVGFKSDFDDVSSVIMAGSATSGATIYTFPKYSSQFPNLIVTKTSILGVVNRLSTAKNSLFRSVKPPHSIDTFDSGNVMGGISRNQLSVAIGNDVLVTTANEVVIGTKAQISNTSSGTGNVVIGDTATGTVRSVVIGQGATASNSDVVIAGARAKAGGFGSIAIGVDAAVIADQTNGVAIGKGAIATLGAVALGQGASNNVGTTYGVSLGSGATSGNFSVAIGNNAAAGTSQISIGRNAKAMHLNSIALGAYVESTAVDQLNIGARHMELKKVSEPVSVPADTGRIFIKDNGVGKMQFCVRLGGTTVVLATEA